MLWLEYPIPRAICHFDILIMPTIYYGKYITN